MRVAQGCGKIVRALRFLHEASQEIVSVPTAHCWFTINSPRIPVKVVLHSIKQATTSRFYFFGD